MYDRFSGIKLWSCERNTENAMSHLHFNEESDYSEENTCENEVFCSTLERNIFTPQLLIYYKQYQNRKSRLVQMPEAATGGALRKKVSFKMSQKFTENSCVRENTCEIAKFYRTPFLQNNSIRLLLKPGHCNNKARDIDCICCRVLDAMLYCFG